MKRKVVAASIVLSVLVPFAADASDLEPLQAGIFTLGAHQVSVYYTVSGDTFEVVTTITPDAGSIGAPIRFVGFLRPGEKALVSAGQFDTTTRPAILELEHNGDLLSATPMTNVVAAK